MSERPNLLLVSYFFPPAATGVRRMLSLVRYLPEGGWRPIVLSVKPVRGQGHDAAPLADPRVAGVPIVRTGSLDPFRLWHLWEGWRAAPVSQDPSLGGKSSSGGQRVMDFLRQYAFFPDDRMGWIPFAVASGISLVRRHRLRAVYSSNYPQSAHVVAGLIKMATGVPWLADFRDGWTQNPAFHRPGNAMMAWSQQAGERFVARHADQIVAVSPPITRHLQSLRPAHLRPARTIWNGIDSAEMAGLTSQSNPPLSPGRLTILYTGTFFGQRRPDLFLAALARLLHREPQWRQRLRVRMRSDLSERERALANRGALADVVEVLAPVPFRECQEEQCRADAFLLILESGPGSEIMVSQKVFEYLAFRRPILALVPPGAAAELLRDSGGASIIHPAPVEEVTKSIQRFLHHLEVGSHPLPADWVLEHFERQSQARALAGMLDQIAG